MIYFDHIELIICLVLVVQDVHEALPLDSYLAPSSFLLPGLRLTSQGATIHLYAAPCVEILEPGSRWSGESKWLNLVKHSLKLDWRDWVFSTWTISNDTVPSMVFVARFSLSPEDVDEAIEGLHGCLKIAILEVFRLLVQLKGSHFEPTLDCSQAGPCNFDGAGKGCVIFLAQRTMALKDYWKMARCYEMPFTFGSHTVLCFLQDTPCRTHSPKPFLFVRASCSFGVRDETMILCFHVSDASHLCTKQRLTRSSPCGLFWSRLANGEVARLVRFSDLSWLVNFLTETRHQLLCIP